MSLSLTPGQRRYLKQLSHHLKPLLQMGKDGPSTAFLGQLSEQLQAHELIKVRILNNCEFTAEEIQAGFNQAEVTVVQKVGHVFTVFKPREEKSRIELPQH